jgi:hypothetical protein
VETQYSGGEEGRQLIETLLAQHVVNITVVVHV